MMRNKFWLSAFAACAVLLTGVSPLHAQRRILTSPDLTHATPLKGTVSPLVRRAADTGEMDTGSMLHGMELNLTMTAAQKADLDTLVRQQQNPASAQYHGWLTQQQYAARFGIDPQDLQSIETWLQSQGMTVDHVAESGNSIRFSGTVQQVNTGFHTTIHKYTLNGQSHFSNATDLSLPDAFTGIVASIHGLNDFVPHPKNIRTHTPGKSAANPLFTSGISGNHFLAPGDMATIYNISPLLSAGVTGAGHAIGIAGQTDILLSDIEDFRSAAGLPANDPQVYLIPGSADPGILYDTDLVEADLDLEWAGAVAQDASVVYINSTDVLTSLQYAVQNRINGILIPVLSISYGDCEPNYSSSDVATYESVFEQAAAQGQTIIAAAGDSGAADCDASYGNFIVVSATQGLNVDYPASSSYVTAIGGAEFNEGNSTGATQYWSANGSKDVLNSALSYIPEMAWDDSPNVQSAIWNYGLAAGGGGKSTLFSKPAWQSGVPGIPSDGARDVPDIAFSASADQDPYLVCTQIRLTDGSYTASCTNGFRYSDDSLTPVGGTSVGAPAFAGMLALIEQQSGTTQGNLNPLLYSLAASSSIYSSAFHDITIGSNAVPCTSGSPDCQSSGVLGYSAGTGYDQATGLGSLNVANFAAAVAGSAQRVTPSLALSFSPASATVGQSVVFTATVTGPAGDAQPDGTMDFLVDGTRTSTAVPIAGNAASVSYVFSSGGSHTVTAIYSGDSNYNSTETVAAVDVSSPASAAPTSLSLGANPGTVPLSGSLTLTATVASQTSGTISGVVTFGLGKTVLGTANVLAGTSGTGTASLTVVADPNLGFVQGANTISATYGGSTQYAQSSATTVVTATAAQGPGFTLTAGNISIPSSAPGYYGSSTITLVSTGGYSGTVNLTSTADTSLNADYSIYPWSVTLSPGGTGTAVITIGTISGSSISGSRSHYSRATTASVAVGGSAAVACLFLFGLGRRRKKLWSLLPVVLAFVALVSCSGCGSSTSGSAPGTYTVTVTATDSSNGSITNSTTFTLTIQ